MQFREVNEHQLGDAIEDVAMPSSSDVRQGVVTANLVTDGAARWLNVTISFPISEDNSDAQKSIIGYRFPIDQDVDIKIYEAPQYFKGGVIFGRTVQRNRSCYIIGEIPARSR